MPKRAAALGSNTISAADLMAGLIGPPAAATPNNGAAGSASDQGKKAPQGQPTPRVAPKPTPRPPKAAPEPAAAPQGDQARRTEAKGPARAQTVYFHANDDRRANRIERYLTERNQQLPGQKIPGRLGRTLVVRYAIARMYEHFLEDPDAMFDGCFEAAFEDLPLTDEGEA